MERMPGAASAVYAAWLSGATQLKIIFQLICVSAEQKREREQSEK